MEYKYYKQGQESNPYEEITETQGAHCLRYNEVASAFWQFEYHWANGWSKYKKQEVQLPCYYFELYAHPQEQFASMEAAFAEFMNMLHKPWAQSTSSEWRQYLYEHAHLERFYKPHVLAVTEQLPAYLLYYHGELYNPYIAPIEKEQAKHFWWSFESAWYMQTEAAMRTEENWQKHLTAYLMRNSETTNTHGSAYKQELKEQLERYKSWLTK